MFEKCTSCGGRIIAGGNFLYGLPFCSEGCVTRFRIKVVEELVPAETIQTAIENTFNSPCPNCNREGPLDLFSWTKVTGMLLAYHIESNSVLCCARCGRKNRLTAAAHCFFLGWWSPRAIFFNIFCLPVNLLAILFIRTQTAPSRPRRNRDGTDVVRCPGSDREIKTITINPDKL